MRLHGNQKILDPALVPILNLNAHITPEKLAERKTLEAELGVLNKTVETERERLHTLAKKSDSEWDSSDWRNYRVGMMELNDTRERRRDIKLDLALLPNPDNVLPPEEPNAFDRFVKSGSDGLSSEEQKDYLGPYEGVGASKGADCFRFSDFVRAENKQRRIVMAPTRSDDASGEEAVGTVIDPTVVQALKFYGDAIDQCRVVRTATGDNRRFLHVDDASQEGEELAAQTTVLGKQDVAIEGVEMQAKTVTSKFITVSVEFLADDEAGMPGIIQDLAYRRIARLMNRRVTVTAANRPNSIIDCIQGQEVKSGAAATLADWRKIVQLATAINKAYRRSTGEAPGRFGLAPPGTGGRPGFMMHSEMEALLLQLQDGDNRPILISSLRDGMLDEILNYPYLVNDHMDGVAANKYPMVFFNGEYYAIRMVGEMMFERFYDSATAANQTVQFLAKTRWDFGPILYTAGDGRDVGTRGPWGARMKIAA